MKEYLDAQAAKTAIPTPAQAEAGNYRKGRVKAHGLPIVIETARGSMRRGIGHDGKPWAVRSPAHYGYISRTEGADGDHVDVYIGPHLKSKKVYVLDQRHADTGRFDEHKVFLGFASARQVLAMYRRAFSDGKADARFGKLMEMSPEQFRDWLAKADTTKPIHRADGGRVNYADGGDIADGMFGTARDYMLETGAERPELFDPYAQETAAYLRENNGTWGQRAPTLEENPHSPEKYSIKERGDQFVATFGKKEAEFKTWDEAAAWLKDQRSPTVWYIDIPQSLKDQAMKKGFPLFSEGAAGAGLAADRNSRDERRSGGAVEHMADGGAPSADGWVDVPDEKSSDWVDVPGTESKPKSEFAWSRAVTDIPSEIGKEAMTNLSAINRGFNPWAEGRGKPGTLAGFFDTGRGIVSLPALAASPITGTARAVLGRTMGNIEHKIGEYIAPDVAAKQDPEKVYEDASGDVDKAMMAMAAGRRAPRAAVNVPPPDTIGDFNVPLTRGEAAGDFNSRVIEQRALRGGMGNPAQRVAQDFMDLRNQRLEEVRGGIGREFDQFGQNVADSPSAGADLAAQAIRTEADRAKRGAQNLYDEAFARPGEFDPEAFRGIGNGIRQRLSAGTDPVIVDERLTPVAARALQDIDENIGHLRIRNDADPMGAPNPADIVGVNLRGVDQARKRLVSLAKGAQAYPPTPDTRAMQAIIGAFDGEIENAIQAGLFRGDPEVIDLLRNARGAWSDYRKTFFPQFGGDDVGRAVQKIIGRAPGYEATPTEVANYLYGATSVGAKGSSVRLAQRVRSILGENSPEWSAVRQGVWDRMTTPTEARLDWGPQKQSERIYEFLNGSGRPFAEAVFTPDERTLMRRYADLLRRMVPPPGAVNYSNNVPMLNKIVDHADHVVGATIGAKIGGIHGAAIGYGAGKGTSFLRNMANARQVAKLMPTLERSMRDWQRAQAVANRAGLPSSPATAAASANLARVAAQLGMDYSAVLSGLTGAVKAGADEEKKKP